DLPPLIANVRRQHNGAMSQMPEQLVEADIYVVDHALHSGIARQTGKPPGKANPDFERRRRFAPRLYFRWWDYLLPVFRVVDRSLPQKKRNRSQERQDQKS